jgi:transposase
MTALWDRTLLTPRNTAHRQYEALRAYLVDRLPGPEVARRFGYTYGALQQLVHQFRRAPNRQFFVDSPRPGVKTDDAIRQRIIQLRKQNQSVYDISEALKKEGIPRTPAAVSAILRQEGFAKLPRRGDAERPPGTKPTAADRADVRAMGFR